MRGGTPARGARRALLAAAMALPVACGGPEAASGPESAIQTPPGFPPFRHPPDNAPTEARIALGRRLFYEKRLSRTGEIACASCHEQAHAFADPRRVSTGVDGRKGVRNAPGLANLAWGESFFWDGGVETLEKQVIAPIISPDEMDLKLEEAAHRLAEIPEYRQEFQRAYGAAPEPSGITRAIASFLRSLVSAGSRHDRFLGGDAGALTAEERRGRDLYMSHRVGCIHCHAGFNLTNETFQNNGLPADPNDVGRARITHDEADVGKFKVPSLRNVAVTAPYMHDGSLATLEEVIEHYDRGGHGHPNQALVISPIGLTAQEKADLLAFLRALTDEPFLRDPRLGPPDADLSGRPR